MPLGTTIAEAVQTVLSAQRDAAIDLNTLDCPPLARPGFEARKRGAESALPGMLHEFTLLVESHAAAIFVTGAPEAVKEFATVAADEGPGVVVSAKALFEDIAKTTEGGLRADRRFSSDTITTFIQGVRQALDGLGVHSIPAPNLGAWMGVKLDDHEAVVKMVKDALISVDAAEELNAIYIGNAAAAEALKAEFGNAFLPVIITDVTEDDVKSKLFSILFKGKNVSINVGNAFDGDHITSAFNKLKQKRTQKRSK